DRLGSASQWQPHGYDKRKNYEEARATGWFWGTSKSSAAVCLSAVTKVFRSKLNRRAMRCPVSGAIPGTAVLIEALRRCHVLFSDDALQGCHPVAVIGFARVRDVPRPPPSFCFPHP